MDIVLVGSKILEALLLAKTLPAKLFSKFPAFESYNLALSSVLFTLM